MVKKQGGNTNGKHRLALRVVKGFVRGRTHRPDLESVRSWGSALETAPAARRSTSKPLQKKPSNSSRRPGDLRPIRERDRVDHILSRIQNLNPRLGEVHNTKRLSQNQRYGTRRGSSITNVVALPRIGYERIAMRIRQGGLRLKIGLSLLAVFVGLVGLPVLVALSVNRHHRLPVLAMMTTRDAHDSILVYRWNQGKVVRVPLSEYLVNVLSAEISPKAPMPALQAAAIAARTYAVRSTQHQLFSTPTFAQAHGADVTDNGVLDLPWLTAAQQQARFGTQANADTVRYEQAVASTDGTILTYQNQPILAFSFQLSPGETRDGTNVFGVPLPYLKSVDCPADKNNPKVQQVLRIPVQTVAQELGLGGTVSPSQFSVSGRDKIGYVHTVVYGSSGAGPSATSWSGPQFAALLHLPSSNFTFVSSGSAAHSVSTSGSTRARSPAPGNKSASANTNSSATSTSNQNSQLLVIETKGIGLDLGMSLNQAAAMAAEGKHVNQILSYFYPGTTLTSDSKWASALKST